MNYLRKAFYTIYLLLGLIFLTSCSEMTFPDGVGRVILKNGYPCVYLNNGQAITRMSYRVDGFVPTNPNGSSREQCVLWEGGSQKLEYNTVINTVLFSQAYDKVHIIAFCVENKNHILRLVQVQKDKRGHGVCSDLAWKPVKYYFGIFAEIERFWDWLFNLNGYTKEEF